MHAIVIDDGELHWREWPDPAPGDHDVVVRVRGAGVPGAAELRESGARECVCGCVEKCAAERGHGLQPQKSQACGRALFLCIGRGHKRGPSVIRFGRPWSCSGWTGLVG